MRLELHTHCWVTLSCDENNQDWMDNDWDEMMII